MPAKKPAASTLQQRAEAFLEKYCVDLAITCDPPLVAVEPDDLVLNFHCKVQLHNLETLHDRSILAGTFEMQSVQFVLNDNNPESWERFAILDAHSHDLTMYTALLSEDEDYGDWSKAVEGLVETAFLSDLFVLHLADIKPEFRGNGLGLLVAQRLVDILAAQTSLVAFVPGPPGMDAADPRFPAAREKLRFYWSRLGAKQVPGTDIWILSPVEKWPTFEQMLSELPPHGKHRRAPKTVRGVQ